MAESSSHWKSDAVRARLKRRNAAERRFRMLGVAAVLVAGVALLTLLVTVVVNGYTAFTLTEIELDVRFDPATLGVEVSRGEELTVPASADYGALLRTSLQEFFPEVRDRAEVRALTQLVSRGARSELARRLQADPTLLGQRVRIPVVARADVDAFMKDPGGGGPDPESTVGLSKQQIAWIEALIADGRVRRRVNWNFFTGGDSREPELAGIGGALIGTVLTLIVTLLVSFPLGVAAAVYLEEFASSNPWTRRIEANINNLAAVPSIVFGLLGLAVFLNVMHLPRSAPVVGGLTLALMTLPVIIIASRSAISAVPTWIRESARGVGASPVQVAAHHVVPLAMPGILTGTLLGLARAMGETAPLLMIGMVAFIVDIPASFTDAASALPVQIFLWADSPERGFVEKVSGAILVLLALLALVNGAAIFLRQRFEHRW